LPWNDKSLFSCQQYLEATGPGGNKGLNPQGAESLGASKSPNNVASTFFSTVHLLRKDLSFETGGAELLSCTGAI